MSAVTVEPESPILPDCMPEEPPKGSKPVTLNAEASAVGRHRLAWHDGEVDMIRRRE